MSAVALQRIPEALEAFLTKSAPAEMEKTVVKINQFLSDNKERILTLSGEEKHQVQATLDKIKKSVESYRHQAHLCLIAGISVEQGMQATAAQLIAPTAADQQILDKLHIADLVLGQKWDVIRKNNWGPTSEEIVEKITHDKVLQQQVSQLFSKKYEIPICLNLIDSMNQELSAKTNCLLV